MISWKVANPFEDDQQVEITLDAENANQYAEAQLSGDDDLINLVSSTLVASSGAFGHMIDLKSVNAIDLDYALQQSSFDIEVTEGEDIISEYDPGIPEEALT